MLCGSSPMPLASALDAAAAGWKEGVGCASPPLPLPCRLCRCPPGRHAPLSLLPALPDLQATTQLKAPACATSAPTATGCASPTTPSFHALACWHSTRPSSQCWACEVRAHKIGRVWQACCRNSMQSCIAHCCCLGMCGRRAHLLASRFPNAHRQAAHFRHASGGLSRRYCIWRSLLWPCFWDSPVSGAGRLCMRTPLLRMRAVLPARRPLAAADAHRPLAAAACLPAFHQRLPPAWLPPPRPRVIPCPHSLSPRPRACL